MSDPQSQPFIISSSCLWHDTHLLLMSGCENKETLVRAIFSEQYFYNNLCIKCQGESSWTTKNDDLNLLFPLSFGEICQPWAHSSTVLATTLLSVRSYRSDSIIFSCWSHVAAGSWSHSETFSRITLLPQELLKSKSEAGRGWILTLSVWTETWLQAK